MTRVLSALLLCVAAMSVGCHHDAPTGDGAIRGQVEIAGATKVTDVTVTLIGPVVRAIAAPATGAFVIDTLPVGSYTLYVDALGTREGQVVRDVVVPRWDETVIDPISFTPIARARGQVLVDGAVDLRGTTITAADGSATSTTESGDFDLAVTLTTQTVIVTRTGCKPKTIMLGALDRGAVRELGVLTLGAEPAEEHTVIGRVRVAGTTDASGVTVTIPTLSLSATTDASGQFAIGGVPAGLHELTVTRGAMHDRIANVVVGLGTASVLFDGALYDLTTIELADGFRVSNATRYDTTSKRSPDGKWLAMFRLDVVGDDQLELWDLETNTVVLAHAARARELSEGGAVQFFGSQAIFTTNYAPRQLLRADPLTKTVTPLASGFATSLHIPAAHATLTMRQAADPHASGTYALVPWDGSAPLDLGILPEGPRVGPTSLVIADAGHVAWRGFDGTTRREADTAVPIGLRVAFAADGSRIALASDHLELWSDDRVVQSGPQSCGSLRLFDEVLWCDGIAYRTTDLTRFDESGWNVIAVAPDGRVALTAQEFYEPATIRRITLHDDAAPTVDELGTFPKYGSYTATSDGFWIYTDRATFVPRSGTPTVKKDALIQAIKIASDGSLLYLDSESALGSSLHRLTSNGVDTVVATDVVAYELRDGYAIYSRTVGNRIEQFVTRPSSGQQLAIGLGTANGLVPISDTELFLNRFLSTAPMYTNGLFRLQLP